MKTIKLILSLFIVLLIIGFHGSDPVQAADIFVVKSNSIKPYDEALNGFKSLVKGRIKVYDLDNNPNNQIVAEIISEKPDLIYTIGSEATALIGKNITKLPIVFSLVSNPERLDLKNSNISGVSINIPMPDQLYFLKQIINKARRVGLLYSPVSIDKEDLTAAEASAQELGLDLIFQPIYLAQDVPSALRTLIDKIDVLWLMMDETALTELAVKHIILTTTRHKIPILAFSPRYIHEGVLLALKPDYYEMGIQAAELAIDILNNQAAAGKIVPPRKLIPVINTKAAKYFGLELE
ncbi:MAG: ABC transporter substrate-binding protein [Candidatus Schekmanbacteria bacterium]|nr:ABC transporter substrate-binding protein [Candidatus Schekmanbacteria bacterium]